MDDVAAVRGFPGDVVHPGQPNSDGLAVCSAHSAGICGAVTGC